MSLAELFFDIRTLVQNNYRRGQFLKKTIGWLYLQAILQISNYSKQYNNQ